MNQKRIKSVGGIQRVKKKRKPMYTRVESRSSVVRSASTVRHIEQKKTRVNIKNKKITRTNLSTHSQKRSLSQGLLLLIRRNWFWLRYFWAIVFVIFSLFFYFNAREKTIVELRPHHKFIEINQQAKFFRYPQEDEIGFGVIALSDEVQLPIEPQGTREVLRKAEGEITIFNEYSSEPQRLLPGTRFMSASGKIFLLGNEPVIIPGKVGNTPGSLNVRVYAADPGPEYNIDLTDFNLIGFQELGLTEKYRGIYATSKEPMVGGYQGTEKFINEKDQQEIQRQLRDMLTNRLQQRLNLEKTDETLLIENTQDIKFDELKYSETVNGKFAVLGARIVSLIINIEDVKKYLKKSLDPENQLSSFVLFSHNDLRMVYRDDIPFDLETDQSIIIEIKGSPLVQSIIDQDRLESELRNYPREDLTRYFEGKYNIDRAIVTVEPFWKKTLSDSSFIINVNY